MPAIAAVLMCLSAISTSVFTLVTIYRLHVPLPYWDEWYTVLHFRQFSEGEYGMEQLASQHNEHRLLFPRLFFFADEMLVRLSGLLNATVTVMLQVANAALLIGWANRLVAQSLHRALLAGFVVLMLFTLRQEQNFTNGFQLQFVGVFTTAALAGSAYVAALDRLADRRKICILFFALSALGCFVATYTMANGVLVGGVLVAAAVLRHAPWPVPVATAILAAALAAMFFHNYTLGESGLPLSHALAHPLPYLRYLTTYLGNPLHARIWINQILGTLGLLLAAGAALWIWAGKAKKGASLKLLVVALFVLASATATAYGRITLGTLQATDSRYATPSLLFWSAIVLFWSPVVFTSSRSLVSSALLGGLIAVLATAALEAEATAWPELAERSTALRRVADSLISGLYDARAAGTYENTPPDEVAPLVPFLREHRLSVFADPDFAALGHPSATLGRIAPTNGCTGTVVAQIDTALGPHGVKLNGTALDVGTRRAPHRIVVADAADKVVGFGSASLPSQPSRLWSAYARADATDMLHAYAKLKNGSMCNLGSVAVAPEPTR